LHMAVTGVAYDSFRLVFSFQRPADSRQRPLGIF
jgi:hypothetical protein